MLHYQLVFTVALISMVESMDGPSRIGCALITPNATFRQVDPSGKECEITLKTPTCYGYCKSSEEGRDSFPNTVQNSSVCAPKIDGWTSVTMTKCPDGFNRRYAKVDVPIVTSCQCIELP